MSRTADLAEHLLSTAPEHVGWSIVESPNSSGCYDELLKWVADFSINEWMTDVSVRRFQLGLVLLWLEAEVIRRKGGEGSLWPVLSNRDVVPWDSWVHSELFTGAGGASARHKELLRGAATHYSLRHTFDEDDAHNWFRLIYLQFGFTHDDAVVRLAPWLSGQFPPVSVQRLLVAEDSGALAFQQVWHSLRMFRLGNLTRPLLESRLRSNPWVLPDWCRDLLEAAKRSSAQVLEVSDLEATELKFFTTPRIGVTNEGQPYFTTSLCNLSELGLDSDEYELKAGEEVLARLIRQADGTYYSDAPEAIILPVRPAVALSLVATDGRIAIHDEAVLWDPMKEVSVYSPTTGTMMPSNERIRPGREVFLIASQDTDVRPEPAESIDLGLGYRLHRIASGWVDELAAYLDEDLVWSATLSITRPEEESGFLRASFLETLDLTDPESANVDPPWPITLSITVDDGWTIDSVKWKSALGFEQGWRTIHPKANGFQSLEWSGGRVYIGNFTDTVPLNVSDVVRPIRLRVKASLNGKRRSVTQMVRVKLVAALGWREVGQPFHHSHGTKLLLREALKHPWSFSLPDRFNEPRDPRSCSFLEGGTLHGRLKTRPSTLPDLGGYGAALYIVDDSYQSRKPVMEVSPCVLDGGVLGSVIWDPDEAGFRIKSSFTDIGSEHQLLAWYSMEGEGSRVLEVAPDALSEREEGWLWSPSGHIRLHGVALLYRGVRLGSWFDFSSSSHAAVQHAPEDVSYIAALLRAWKAPLLQEDGGNFMRYCDWLREHWVKILPVWLSTDALIGPDEFEWPAPSLSRNWLAVVGEFLLHALPVPTVEAAGEIVEALAPNCGGANAIGTAVWRIAEGCPLLAARVTRIYLDEFVSAKERQAFFNLILACPDLAVTEDRADEIGKIHGNRDGFWLASTVPPLNSIEDGEYPEMSHAYRLLSKSREYRLYALGRWLREIR